MSEPTSGRVSSCPEACKAVLIAGMDGIDLTVSTAPPLIPSAWTQSFLCPHGVRFYMEPTSEQRAAWTKDGVE